MRNLDREPGFWLTVAILLPFILAIEVLCRVDDLRNRRRRRR